MATGRRSLQRLVAPALPVLWMIGIMWVVEVANALLDHRLSGYGIFPRTAQGLIGIPLAPFLHGSLTHVASNTVPLLVLGTMIGFGGRGRLAAATIVATLLGGVGVWIFGRSAYHVGASILVFGYFGFIVAAALYERSVVSIVVAALTLVIYSGLVWGVLPHSPGVSWEGHLFGLLGGVAAAWMLAKK